jgi:hypothetical protein
VDFDELLTEFRALGGVADNVRLGTGARGRGIFLVDPLKPATLHAPEALFVPVADLELRDGQLVVRAGALLGARARAFFELLQRHFGWGSGAGGEIAQSQLGWSRLPQPVVDAILRMGVSEDLDIRFAAPTAAICVDHFVRGRQFRAATGKVLVPFVDLVNYSGDAKPYVTEGGIGVAGTFEDEMLVRYNTSDTWNHAIGHGFSERAPFAYSVALDMEIDGKHVSVGRATGKFDLKHGVVFPRVRAEGNAVDLSFALLGQTAAPDLPRAVFRRVMEPYLEPGRVDLLFDNIAYFNQMKFLQMLRTLRQHEGPIVRMLEDAAIGQLETLSCRIGSRELP